MSTVDPPQHAVAETLVGRVEELELIRSFLDEAAADGAALLVSGEAGVGKTVLLDSAAEMALADGSRVVRASGVEFEADVSFSGLNQALLPLSEEFARLSAVHRGALSVALGLGSGPAPDRLILSTAALLLLRQSAEARPLLLIVDDLPWIDRASAAVLGFVARRLAGSRVGFLAGSRSGTAGFFDRVGLPEVELQPLDVQDATQLITARFPTLAHSVRTRLLAEAQGNPLALLELPGALSSPQQAAVRALPSVLPLSRRLEGLFASTICELPAPTRHLLLLAALDGTGNLRLLQAVESADRLLGDLPSGEHERLIYIDERSHRIAFRHPLIRSAVVELSTATERRLAHRALAEILWDQPERQAWHLGEATVEAGDKVAELLEQAAHIALQRGNPVRAVAALTRAADLSPERSDRSRRLVEAAYIGANLTGELRGASQLLDEARDADPQLSESLHAAATAAYLLLTGDGDVDTAHRLLVGAIEAGAGDYDANDDALIDALNTLYVVCRFGGRPEPWEPFDAALARLTPEIPTELYLLSTIDAIPPGGAAPVISRLTDTVASLADETDPWRVTKVSSVADFFDRGHECRDALRRVVRDERDGEAVGPLITSLSILCQDAFKTGRWDEIPALADEGLHLCERHGYRHLEVTFRGVLARLAALRGDVASAELFTDQMVQWGAPRGAHLTFQLALHTRVLTALGQGEFEDAYQHAAAISPPGSIPRGNTIAPWGALDLVEAAVRTNRDVEAAAHVDAIRAADLAARSSRMALLAGGAAALAAPDGRTAELFEETLAIPGVDRWTFDLARVQLAYGERLRRARAAAEARVHLAAAVEGFERLRAAPWVARAANELRAAGQVTTRADVLDPTSLTPQEREIAELAAAGLTNKQIAERLFLSHRTVGAHLYRVFPKLGITSRAALRDALLPSTENDENNRT